MSTHHEHTTVFGFSQDPEFAARILSGSLTAPIRHFSFGAAGQLFFSSSSGEMAEDDELLVFKTGFVRSPDQEVLSAGDILESRVVHASGLQEDKLRGHALVAAFSKQDPSFTVYKTLLTGHPLYVYQHADGVICANQLRILVERFEELEPDESMLLDHLIYLGTPGARTCLRGVRLLRSGECLVVRQGRVETTLVKHLQSLREDPSHGRRSRSSPELYEEMSAVVGTYFRDMTASGQRSGNLLSGGVDSSFTQLLINEHVGESRSRSYSFRMRSPSFEPEVHYARQAARALGTEHTFIDVQPGEYIDLLERTSRLVCQPVYGSIEPCKLALVDALSSDTDGPDVLFHSTAGDTQFGGDVSRTCRRIEQARQWPGSAFLLQAASRLLPGSPEQSQRLRNRAAIIRDPLHPLAPVHTEAGICDLSTLTAWFGEEALVTSLRARSGLEEEYLDSPSYREKTQTAICLHPILFLATQEMLLFQSRGMELLCPFLDEDFIRISYSVPPEQRYLDGRRVKPILRDLLAARTDCVSARGPKRASHFNPDLRQWLMQGPLHDLVRSIDRPGCISPAAFDSLFTPAGFRTLWGLLTWDLFRKQLRDLRRQTA